jgi:5-methylcytosine-specific restriction protein A
MTPSDPVGTPSDGVTKTTSPTPSPRPSLWGRGRDGVDGPPRQGTETAHPVGRGLMAHDAFYNLNAWKRARAATKQRDGYACTHCGRTGIPLDVDHILGWRHRPDLAFELDNLRTLCRRCHNQRTHGKPKRRNSRRAEATLEAKPKRRNSRRC